MKGTDYKNSDYDFLVLFSEIDRRKKMDVYGIISDLIYKYNVFIDLKIMTPNQFERNPVFMAEVKKGLYYGRI